jgi:tetratricopeptide (TPR) repeat protein
MTERIDSLRKMMADEPEDDFLPYALAMEFMGIKDYKTASEALEKIVAKSPSYLASYYQLGKCYEELDEINPAIEILKKGMKVAQDQNDQKALGEIKEALWYLEED